MNKGVGRRHFTFQEAGVSRSFCRVPRKFYAVQIGKWIVEVAHTRSLSIRYSMSMPSRLPETTPILQSPRLMPKRADSARLLPQLLAKKLLPRASQGGLKAMDGCQKNVQ